MKHSKGSGEAGFVAGGWGKHILSYPLRVQIPTPKFWMGKGGEHLRGVASLANASGYGSEETSDVFERLRSGVYPLLCP